MSDISVPIALLLAVAMVVVAVMAIWPGRSRAIAILSAGAISLFASILFLVLAAPDVALAEAAIGSGLTTFLFFFVLGRVRGGKSD